MKKVPRATYPHSAEQVKRLSSNPRRRPQPLYRDRPINLS